MAFLQGGLTLWYLRHWLCRAWSSAPSLCLLFALRRCFYYLLVRCIIKQEFMHLPKAWWGFLRAESMVPHMHAHCFRSLLMASEWGSRQRGNQRGGVRSENQMENPKAGLRGQPGKTWGGSKPVFPVLIGSCEQLTVSQYLVLTTALPMLRPAYVPKQQRWLAGTAPKQQVYAAPSSANTASTSTARSRVTSASRTKKIRRLPGKEVICPSHLTLGMLKLFRILPGRNTAQWRIVGERVPWEGCRPPDQCSCCVWTDSPSTPVPDAPDQAPSLQSENCECSELDLQWCGRSQMSTQ